VLNLNCTYLTGTIISNIKASRADHVAGNMLNNIIDFIVTCTAQFIVYGENVNMPKFMRPRSLILYEQDIIAYTNSSGIG
jgi:hypothetical protein